MAIYVDIVRHYPHCNLRYKYWCHMVSDTSLEELHEMAAKVGLKREWFQAKSRPHYDMVPTKRRLAIMLGAIEITDRVEFYTKANALRSKDTSK